MTSHNRKWKEAQLADLKSLLSRHSIVALADIRMFPASLFQLIRKQLHGKAIVRVSKTKVIKKALSEFPQTSGLAGLAHSNCAVIFTDMNPFELFAFLKKNKGKVAATAGAIAEEDIVIPAGDTGIAPGPALSELKAAGLKVAVQGPTISVMEDKVVIRAGEPVSQPVATTLTKLSIFPFKVGLKLIAASEGKQLFMASILDIDTGKVFSEFISAHRNSFNLAFNAGITNKATIGLLLAKSFSSAKAVALDAGFPAGAAIPELLARANAQASSLKSLAKEGT